MIAADFPQLVQAVYVDDVNLEYRGDADNNKFPKPSQVLPRYLAKQLGLARAMHIADLITDTTDIVARATTQTISYFESLGMEVSATKSMVTASTPAAAKLLEASIPAGRVKAVHPRTGQPAKMLGVGTKGGSVRTTKVYNKRVQQFKKKTGRFKTLKNHGFATRYAVQAATAMPAIGYGLEAAGISNSALRQLRCMVNNAAGTATGGGNHEVELLARDALHGRLDPAFDAHTKPLAAWATAWWDKWRPHDQLEKSFKKADADLRSCGNHSNIWQRVRGPTAAAIATASRIGWHFSDPRHLHTDDGETFDLTRDPPAAVVQAIHAAVIRWRSANVLQHHSATMTLLQSPKFTAPAGVLPAAYDDWLRAKAMASIKTGVASLDNAINGKKHPQLTDAWRKQYGPYLASAMSNKQWTQARCAAARGAGWTKDSTCRLCNSEPGTEIHRHKCPAIWPLPQPPPPPAAQRDIAAKTQHQRELWQTRGLGGTRVFVPQRQEEEHIEWLKQVPDDAVYHELDWYVDASQIDARTESAARFGIGAVAVNTRGDLVAAMRAVPPRRVASIPSAEAWAISAVLQATPARRTVYTDCKSNLAILAKGKQWATDGKRASARTWQSIFHSLDDDQSAIDAIVWMPAHKTRAQVGTVNNSNGLPINIVDWMGNMAADELAKSAAHSVRVPAHIIRKLEDVEAAAAYWRCMLGETTYKSQNFPVQTTMPDGTVAMTVKRDSDGKPPGNVKYPHDKPASDPTNAILGAKVTEHIPAAKTPSQQPSSVEVATASVVKSEVNSALARCRFLHPSSASTNGASRPNQEGRRINKQQQQIHRKNITRDICQLDPHPVIPAVTNLSAADVTRRERIAKELCATAVIACETDKNDNGRGVYKWLWSEGGGHEPHAHPITAQSLIIHSDDETPRHAKILSENRSNAAPRKAVHNILPKITHRPNTPVPWNTPVFHHNGHSASLSAGYGTGLMSSIRRLLGYTTGGNATHTNAPRGNKCQGK